MKRSDLAGKTGTTNDQRDAWFAGFHSSLVALAWVGFDDFRQLGSGEQGGVTALPMWIDYMRVVLKDVPQSNLNLPAGMVSVRIDSETGKLTKADNPKAIFEFFRSEHVPVQTETPNNQVGAEKFEQTSGPLF